MLITSFMSLFCLLVHLAPLTYIWNRTLYSKMFIGGLHWDTTDGRYRRSTLPVSDD